MSPLPRLGSQIGNYRLIDFIDAGGMGAVYLAEHLYLERKAALKVLSEDLAEDESFRRRFLRESRLAERLAKHPHVITIYDAGEVDGRLYMAMYYVEGTDLRSLLKSEWPLDVHRVVSIISQVASALDAAHAIDLVHRDVKPANILIEVGADGDDHCYMADFGLVREMRAGTRLTRTGYMLGTPHYMAPEQISPKHAGYETLDGRADVYALGAVLFECLTGKPAYAERLSVEEVVAAQLNAPPPRVSNQRTDLPDAVDAVVVRAMAKRRESRFATCGDLATAAQAALVRSDTAEDRPTVAGDLEPTMLVRASEEREALHRGRDGRSPTQLVDEAASLPEDDEEDEPMWVTSEGNELINLNQVELVSVEEDKDIREYQLRAFTGVSPDDGEDEYYVLASGPDPDALGDMLEQVLMALSRGDRTLDLRKFSSPGKTRRE